MEIAAFRRVLEGLGVFFLLVILSAELVLSVQRQSQTYDEAFSISAGYRYWKCAQFGVNPWHPPLVKLVAALPLLPLHLQVPGGMCSASETGISADMQGGRQFLYSNEAETVLLRARLAVVPFTLVLAIMVFAAARTMFGATASRLALIVFMFEPNFLAHGALVTTDVPLTCCLFAAVYAFYLHVRQPSLLRLFMAGSAAGLTIAAKHSGIIVVPIVCLLAAAVVLLQLRNQPSTGSGNFLRQRVADRIFHLAAAILVILGIAVVVLWASYGFRFVMLPVNRNLPSNTPNWVDDARDIGTQGAAYGSGLPKIVALIPLVRRYKLLPEAYLAGLYQVSKASVLGRRSFLFGKLHATGIWFYFPAAFVIKSTLGFLSLVLLTFLVSRNLFSQCRLGVIFMSVPPILFLAISMASRLNIGVRHILPIYPFLIVLVAGAASSLAKRHHTLLGLVGLLLVAHIVSSVLCFPNYLAYSNEVWGGPMKTYRVLSDSNVDWGQGLKQAAHYLEGSSVQKCWFAYHGSADPKYYGIPCQILLPEITIGPVDLVPKDVNGTVLVSVAELQGLDWGPDGENPYQNLQEMSPVANLGGSILVFKGHVDLSRACGASNALKAAQLAASGRLNEAVDAATIAVQVAPNDWRGHWVLGDVLAAQKHKSKARAEYKIALSLAVQHGEKFYKQEIAALQGKLADFNRNESTDLR